MLNVHFTIDVEIWCGGWHDIDRRFPECFDRYLHGPGGQGGLPFQLDVLADHGIRSTCFVEPLFATRFGPDPLAEVVAAVQQRRHEVQLHLHTEWVDEARPPVLEGVSGKRQHLHQYSRDEQSRLIGIATGLLMRAGAPRPTGFRAGSFAFDANTLPALADHGFTVDASYNASMYGPGSGVCAGEALHQPRRVGPLLELPMTVFHDGRSLRHAQLTACSFREMEGLLWQALERGDDSFVILSHNFELWTGDRQGVDRTVLRRLTQLARFLHRHRDVFRIRTVGECPTAPAPVSTPFLTSPIWRTGLRMGEQAWRRWQSRVARPVRPLCPAPVLAPPAGSNVPARALTTTGLHTGTPFPPVSA